MVNVPNVPKTVNTPTSTSTQPDSSDGMAAFTLVEGDFLERSVSLPDNSFDLAIVDPPYGASTQGRWELPDSHNLVGMGGRWALASHEWDRIAGLESLQFTLLWLEQAARLVRPTGSIWLHSTYHNSGIANVACQMLGLEIINEVVWYKRNAFPNLSGRRLTASHETILWVHTGDSKKRQYRFNYEEAKDATFREDLLKKPDKQLRTVWDIPNNKARDELAYGKHPTQKPLRLIARLLLVAGTPGGRLLVPFAGSGSEMVGALRYGMTPVGYEIDATHEQIARKRLEAETARSGQLVFGEGLGGDF